MTNRAQAKARRILKAASKDKNGVVEWVLAATPGAAAVRPVHLAASFMGKQL